MCNQVNSSPVVYPWDQHQAFALSNCSNSGLNLMAAYFNGTDIVYKYSPTNSMVFSRPPIAGNGSAAKGAFNSGAANTGIWPNPVKETLHLNGAAGNSYTISDLTGKAMMEGAFGADRQVPAATLPAGVYLLRTASKDGSARIIKFTKD